MNDTLNIEKGTVLYKRSDGSEILFTRTNDEDFYASVRNPNGKVFEEQLLGSILRRGDWEATYEIVKKHGDHDQSSHGSWASGNFNEESEGESAQGKYFDTYGVEIKTNEPVGIQQSEIEALNFYTGDGYTDINNNARFGIAHPEESVEAIIQDRISNLDTLIEQSPDMFGDKNLFRVFDKSLIDTLEKGDVLTDKGFMSTTRVDITSKEGLEVLQNLQLIRVTDDRASIILPSESKTGKGLAVDYLKNAISDAFTNVATANNEKEVLLPRGTSLKFMGYKKVNEGADDVMDVAVFQRLDK